MKSLAVSIRHWASVTPMLFQKRGRALAPRGDLKWKHAMRLMRLAPVWQDLSDISALRKGELRLHLDEHRAALLAVKPGEKSWPEVNNWRLRLHKEFNEAFASAKLLDRLDYA